MMRTGEVLDLRELPGWVDNTRRAASATRPACPGALAAACSAGMISGRGPATGTLDKLEAIRAST